jgi:beta-fructofuranosidase
VRPAYHFTPRRGWVNDPLGVTFRPGGGAEIFFQYVPAGTTWQPGCHWGRAVSPDLAVWEETGSVLEPGDGDDGCWSGCALPSGVLLYTSVQHPDLARGRIREAMPTDDPAGRWVKGRVAVDVPADAGVRMFRDPFVWRDGRGWRMLVGASLDDGSAAALTFVALDARDWTYDGIFARRHPREDHGVGTGSMWECPQVLQVDGFEFLVVSVWEDDVLQYVACARGVSSGGRFVPAEWQRLSFGPCHYAATSVRDDAGCAGLMYWLRGVADPVGGWAGALSVPHRLSVRRGRLVAEPHPRLLEGRRGPVLVTDAGGGGDEGRSEVELPSFHCEVVADVHGEGPVELSWAAGAALLLTMATDGRGSWSLRSPVGLSARVEKAGSTVTVLLDGAVAEIFLGEAGVAAVPVSASDEQPAPTLTVASEPRSGARIAVCDMSRNRGDACARTGAHCRDGAAGAPRA